MIDLRCGDCLELMKDIPDKSIDMILCDLPYGTTACKWDIVIPFEPLWEQYNRIIKDNGAIVLFGSEPFSSRLRMSNMKNYRYDWIWEKATASNFCVAKYQPLKQHEVISVFYKKAGRYYPIKEKRNGSGEDRLKYGYKSNGTKSDLLKFTPNRKDKEYDKLKYPATIQYFNNKNPNERGLHPTQKPVALLEYLIKTYTNENETVLDNCMGSGSTGVACINTNRNFIGIELDDGYFNIAKKRIEDVSNNKL